MIHQYEGRSPLNISKRSQIFNWFRVSLLNLNDYVNVDLGCARELTVIIIRSDHFFPIIYCQQEVGYNIIENLEHGFWFVIEFHLEHMGSDVDQFKGSVCVEPKDLPVGEKCPVNKRVNLGITEDFELKVSHL